MSCESICRLEAEICKYEKNNFETNKQLQSYEYELKHLEKEYHCCFKQEQILREKCNYIEDEFAATTKEYETSIKEQEEKEKIATV